MNSPDKYRLLDDLFNLFLNTNLQPGDDELFGEWEIEIDSILKKNMALFRQLKTETKAELYRAKHERVMAFLAKLKQGIESNQEKYLKIADSILAKPQFTELQPQFRNRTNLSDKDKAAIVVDTKLLDLLSEIQEECSPEKDEK
jgi:hypothetical protein